MNGVDLINNLIDELNRAIDFLWGFVFTDLRAEEAKELIDDIRADLDRYYDCADELDEAVRGIKVE